MILLLVKHVNYILQLITNVRQYININTINGLFLRIYKLFYNITNYKNSELLEYYIIRIKR